MGGYKSYTSYGNVAASEYDFVLQPIQQRAQNVGVVWFHGSGHPYALHDITQPNFGILGAMIAEAGIPVVTAEFHDQGWGKPSVTALLDAAMARMHAICGTRTDKCIVAGASMGGYTALRSAMDYPAKVLAVAGVIPLTNMTYFYNNNIGGAQAEIAAAWGVATGAALPAASQVQENAASFAMPIKLYYSNADTTIRPIDTTTFAAGAPHCTAVNVGANGHSDLTAQDVINYGAGRGQDLINFLKQNGA